MIFTWREQNNVKSLVFINFAYLNSWEFYDFFFLFITLVVTVRHTPISLAVCFAAYLALDLYCICTCTSMFHTFTQVICYSYMLCIPLAYPCTIQLVNYVVIFLLQSTFAYPCICAVMSVQLFLYRLLNQIPFILTQTFPHKCLYERLLTP